VQFAALIFFHLVRDSLVREESLLTLEVVEKPGVGVLRPKVGLHENSAFLLFILLALDVALDLALQSGAELSSFGVACSLLILDCIVHNVNFLEQGLSLLHTLFVLLLDGLLVSFERIVHNIRRLAKVRNRLNQLRCFHRSLGHFVLVLIDFLLASELTGLLHGSPLGHLLLHIIFAF